MGGGTLELLDDLVDELKHNAQDIHTRYNYVAQLIVKLNSERENQENTILRNEISDLTERIKNLEKQNSVLHLKAHSLENRLAQSKIEKFDRFEKQKEKLKN